MTNLHFNYYVRNDAGFFPAEEKDTPALNENRHDVYWTPQEFKAFGARKKEDLVSIRFVCADFDNITKKDFLYKIKFLPKPSFIISTRSGFHIYWHLKKELEPTPKNMERYSDLIRNYLVPIGADPQAVDVCRILRVPFRRYWRDSKGTVYDAEEIYCDIISESDTRFSFEDLERLLPRKKSVTVKTLTPVPKVNNAPPGDFWTKANQLPCRESLERLSGTPHVSMETYTFKAKSDGTTRIIIDGKPRNVWLDKDGKIGSVADGGPSIPNWLNYYHKDWARVAKILKEVFGL